MYAVIQTGGKQYRVRAGDVIVVEKLDGDVGAEIKFDKVLMAGGGENGVSLGDKLEGALVHATLIETRKGEKVKVFKKIRRQGYRRTQGHRQFESVLRITGLDVGGETAKWDGTVDLTPRSVLVARARGLAPMLAADAAEVFAVGDTETAATPKKAKASKAPKAADVEDETAMMDVPVSEQPDVASEVPAPRKAKAAKAQAASTEETVASEEAALQDAAPLDAAPQDAAPMKAAAPKKPKAAAPKGDA